MNDNERLGLPADIDLLEIAIKSLQRNPERRDRVEHLLAVINRVHPQVEAKLEALKD